MYEKAAELLDRLPEDYVEDDYRAKLQKLGGLAVPLNIFLFQVMQYSMDFDRAMEKTLAIHKDRSQPSVLLILE